MILVWYDAEGREPEYRISAGHDPIPADFVFHGRLQHTVRCLIQDIPENGSDLAHFKAVHEDGEKAFGLLGWILKLRLIFLGNWKVDSQVPEMAVAEVRNHIQLWGVDFKGTEQVVHVNQIGPGVVFEDAPQGVTGNRIILVQSVTPLRPFLHLEQTRAYSKPGFMSRVGVHLFMQGFKGNLEEDIKMQNNKKYLAKPLLVAGDGPIMKFRRWYGNFFSENSARTVEQFYHREEIEE
jgi:cholesterol 7-dehydrogenase